MAQGPTVAAQVELLGLRTDTPASKCPTNYSPDCSDLIFAPGETSSRPPFLASITLPAEALFYKEFTARDGSLKRVALDINGVLYSIDEAGTPTQIDQVVAGSSVSSIIAYGRIYMAFYKDGQAVDAPRQWDGKNVRRVSQGAPGAPPRVSNYTISATSIDSAVRDNNIVTIVTSSPHGLIVGYSARIAGLLPALQNITSIVIDNDTNPGVAIVTTPAPHGFVPGNSVEINGVTPIVPGGSFVSWSRTDTIVTVTTSLPHGIIPGATALVELNTDGYGAAVITSVPTPTTFTFSNSGGNGSGSVGSVLLPWPFPDGTLFQIQATPTSTTFEISVTASSGTWNSGTIGFEWDGSFYVETVPDATTFTYRQIGPNATADPASLGTVTPTGQLAAGDHLVAQHFITDTGFVTPPSPQVKFTASGGQYALIEDLAIGPPNVIARILSFTPVNGSSRYFLQQPARIAGIQVSTSTRVNDNTTTSVVVDFSDITLQTGQQIDIDGYNLPLNTPLNLPRAVRWYGDRLFWVGEKNTVFGFLNMGMDGGTHSASTLPLGWTPVGNPSVVQAGFMPALEVTGPDSGEIWQPASLSTEGAIILQPSQPYSLRFWMDGSSSKIGSLQAIISSASSGFTSTAMFALSQLNGSAYYTMDFNVPVPSVIPADMRLTVKFVGLVGTARYRDLQPIFASNPNRNPIARASYIQNPENYDIVTGNIGPNNDSTELRGLFFLGQNLYFVTAQTLQFASNITNSEPSSWYVDCISDKCGAFNQECIAVGKGWAAWGGPLGAFWFTGGIPRNIAEVIMPTWRELSTVTNAIDDATFERVYFGVVDKHGNRKIMVYDYHETNLGGPGKWCPWNRPVQWIAYSSTGSKFLFGVKVYGISDELGIEDEDLGPIGAYNVFSPIAASMFQKNYSYLGLEIDGDGPLTPFCYTGTLATPTETLNAQNLATLTDTVAEWPMNVRGRRLWMKVGQPGVRFSLRNMSVIHNVVDSNAPVSGVR